MMPGRNGDWRQAVEQRREGEFLNKECHPEAKWKADSNENEFHAM